MSSSTLTNYQYQLIHYGYPICIILGNIGSFFIVILFSQHRQSPCSLYLISSAVFNDVYLTFSSFTQLIPPDYRVATLGAVTLCKMRLYLVTAFGQIAKTLLVLACIDRFLITSDRASLRAFSTTKRTKWIILFSVIFWSLADIHIAIMGTINNSQCGYIGIYATFFSIYIIVFVGLIPPVILIVFGYLIRRNLRRRLFRVQPITNNTIDTNSALRRRDRDLLILIISEVVVYIVAAVPYPLILIETFITKYTMPNKTVQYLQIENFITSAVVLLLFANAAAPFYIYLISSKPFRRDFKQLIINGYRKLRKQPQSAPVPVTHHNLREQDTPV